MSLDLPPGEVQVWWSPAAPLSPAAVATLTAEERAQHDRFHFATDRDAWGTVHVMLRRLLTGYRDHAAPLLPLAATARGKPFLPGGPAFSLSHTRGFVACCFARELEVGVDVESVERTNDWRHLLDRVTSAAEAAHLEALPAAARQQRFYELWTLKEAWAKAIGEGLHADFRGLDVLAPPAGVHLELLPVAPPFRLAVAVLGTPSRVSARPFAAGRE